MTRSKEPRLARLLIFPRLPIHEWYLVPKKLPSWFPPSGQRRSLLREVQLQESNDLEQRKLYVKESLENLCKAVAAPRSFTLLPAASKLRTRWERLLHLRKLSAVSFSRRYYYYDFLCLSIFRSSQKMAYLLPQKITSFAFSLRHEPNYALQASLACLDFEEGQEEVRAEYLYRVDRVRQHLAFGHYMEKFFASLDRYFFSGRLDSSFPH